MFVLAVLKDTISIRPHEFAKNVEEVSLCYGSDETGILRA